jgi:urocanate hydratase
MVLDGSPETDTHLRMMINWDVNNGISRRSWARNKGAMFAINREMERTPGLVVTIPNIADDKLIEDVVGNQFRKKY